MKPTNGRRSSPAARSGEKERSSSPRAGQERKDAGKREGTGRKGTPAGRPAAEPARRAFEDRRTQRASGEGRPGAAGRATPGRAPRPATELGTPVSSPNAGQGTRLQRVLAGAGVGSRRHCEELIAAGRVSVDGAVVDRQGMRVDPEVNVVRVDGERIATQADSHYVILNKPRGFLTTLADDRGRPCVGDLLEGRTTRLFHVGRLDADSEGLLLLTNDGELANRLMHPKYRVPKTYLVEVHGPVRRPAVLALRRGVPLDGEVVEVDALTVTADAGDRVLIEITIHEGRKHVVRRLLEEVGHPVLRLVRLSVGPVQLGGLKPGRTRVLGHQEVSKLYGLVDTPADREISTSASPVPDLSS